MKIIAPHLSCVVNLPLSNDEPDEFIEAINQGYVEIFVMTPQGIIKHHKLRGTNRYLRLKVESIPGVQLPHMDEEINFLPAGKIPYALIKQIEAFFRKVMAVKQSDLEAMIWVLYNEAQGYHLWVPDQTISKASVRYDWDSVPAGSSIVCDIHSHNTMGAFFSGTDNNDDRGAIGFSGVFGQLDKATPQTVWRFNYRDKKYEATMEDIFESPQIEAIEIPDAWIDQVKVQTYTTGYKGQNRTGAPGYPPVGGNFLGSYLGYGSHLKDRMDKVGKRHQSDNDDDEGRIEKPAGGTSSKKDVSPTNQNQHEAEGSGLDGEFWGMSPDTMSLTDLILSGAETRMSQESIISEDEGDFVPNTIIDNVRFDELMVNSGPRVAVAYCEIGDRMVDLEGEDDLLKDLALEMMGMVEDTKVKAKVFREMYDLLPQVEKDRLAQSGF